MSASGLCFGTFLLMIGRLFIFINHTCDELVAADKQCDLNYANQLNANGQWKRKPAAAAKIEMPSPL